MAGAKTDSQPLWQWFLPFLSWIGELKKADTPRADIIAGITVALVLVPQSMAYAQLAGLPSRRSERSGARSWSAFAASQATA